MAQQFTNFCCRSGGSNLNAGTRTGSDTVPGTSADFTYASGNWVASTGVFTVASGNPSSDGVAVGDFASVYPNGNTVTPFVGRVTARDATTITVSLTVKSGTAPTNGTGDRTLKIGGAWRGPDSTTTHPLEFAAPAMKDTTGRLCRVNFKNDVVYESFTQVARATNMDAVTWQGFTSSYGDLGRAEIRGNPAANPIYYLILNMNGGGIAQSATWKDLILGSNGDEGSNAGIGHGHVGLMSYAALVLRCSANHNWISSYDFNGLCVEGECYDYDYGGSVNMGAWVGSSLNLRCIAHDSNPLPHPYTITGVNIIGFHTNYANFCCIAHNIHGSGYDGFTGAAINCDAFNCDRDGIILRDPCLYINSNACQNTLYGFSVDATNTTELEILSCRYGTGTEDNDGGNVNALIHAASDVSGYPANQSPWVDVANGNFTLFLDDAFETGRGQFTQTMPGYGGSVSYPDIGAARHESHVRNMTVPTGFGGGMG